MVSIAPYCSGVRLAPASEGSAGRPASLLGSAGLAEESGGIKVQLAGVVKKERPGFRPHRPANLSTLPLPYLSVNVKKLFVFRFWIRGALARNSERIDYRWQEMRRQKR